MVCAQEEDPPFRSIKKLDATLKDGTFMRDTSPAEQEHCRKRLRGTPSEEECVSNLDKSLEDAGGPAMNPVAVGPGGGTNLQEDGRNLPGENFGEDGGPSEEPKEDSSHLFDKDVQMVGDANDAFDELEGEPR